MFLICKTFFFYGEKTSVSNSTPCNDKRYDKLSNIKAIIKSIY